MTINLSLPPHLEAFIDETVSSGRYSSASDVVGTALRLLEVREQEQAAKLLWLQQEIRKGLASGPSAPLDMDIIKQLGRERLERIGKPS